LSNFALLLEEVGSPPYRNNINIPGESCCLTEFEGISASKSDYLRREHEIDIFAIQETHGFLMHYKVKCKM
jgi:hypothetical protein